MKSAATEFLEFCKKFRMVQLRHALRRENLILLKLFLFLFLSLFSESTILFYRFKKQI